MTDDEIRKQIIGDVVEEFAGIAGEKPTYAEVFVSAFGPLAVRVKRVETPSDDAMHKSGLITQAAFDQYQSEQTPTPSEPTDESKKVNFREFF